MAEARYGHRDVAVVSFAGFAVAQLAVFVLAPSLDGPAFQQRQALPAAGGDGNDFFEPADFHAAAAVGGGAVAQLAVFIVAPGQHLFFLESEIVDAQVFVFGGHFRIDASLRDSRGSGRAFHSGPSRVADEFVFCRRGWLAAPRLHDPFSGDRERSAATGGDRADRAEFRERRDGGAGPVRHFPARKQGHLEAVAGRDAACVINAFHRHRSVFPVTPNAHARQRRRRGGRQCATASHPQDGRCAQHAERPCACHRPTDSLSSHCSSSMKLRSPSCCQIRPGRALVASLSRVARRCLDLVTARIYGKCGQCCRCTGWGWPGGGTRVGDTSRVEGRTRGRAWPERIRALIGERAGWERPAATAKSAPGEIRTPDLRFRRPTLYPAELRAQSDVVYRRGLLRPAGRPTAAQAPGRSKTAASP